MGRPSQCMTADVGKLELLPFLVARAVAAALEEDLGQAGDITTDPIIPADATAEARDCRAETRRDRRPGSGGGKLQGARP